MTDAPRRFKLVHGRRHIPLVPGEFVLGRGAAATIPVLDDEASRKHALIRVAGERLSLEDLASVNGTFVNGVRVRSITTLHAGDEVRIGRTVLMVDLQGQPGPADDGSDTRKFQALQPDEITGPGFAFDDFDDESTVEKVVEPLRETGADYSRLAAEMSGQPKTVVLLGTPDNWEAALRRANEAETGGDLEIRVADLQDAAMVAGSVRFGLLCLDIAQAGADAVKILERWRSPSPRGPVLIVSAAPPAEGVSLARALKTDAYLSRDTPPGEFLTCVRNLLPR